MTNIQLSKDFPNAKVHYPYTRRGAPGEAWHAGLAEWRNAEMMGSDVENAWTVCNFNVGHAGLPLRGMAAGNGLGLLYLNVAIRCHFLLTKRER